VNNELEGMWQEVTVAEFRVSTFATETDNNNLLLNKRYLGEDPVWLFATTASTLRKFEFLQHTV
jgi:hypothetical protein